MYTILRVHDVAIAVSTTSRCGRVCGPGSSERVQFATGGLPITPSAESDFVTRYIFHIQDQNLVTDRTEAGFSSLQDVRAHAIELSARALLEGGERDWTAQEWQVTVTDADGSTVFTLNFLGQDAMHLPG